MDCLTHALLYYTFTSSDLTGVILIQSALAVIFFFFLGGVGGVLFHYNGLCFSLLPVILVYYVLMLVYVFVW